MKKTHYPDEKGSIVINGQKFNWIMKRSKGESAFGIQGSRIFELKLFREDILIGSYAHGWEKRINPEDEDGILCLQHLMTTYGREKRKERKEKWKESM